MTTALEIRSRLQVAEELMASSHQSKRIQSQIQERLRVSPSTARRYMRAVRKLWVLESTEDTTAARAELVGRLKRIFDIAMNRIVEAEDEDGKGYTYRESDLRSAIRCAERIAEVRGVERPQPQVNQTQNVVVLVPEGERGDVALAELTERARKARMVREGR